MSLTAAALRKMLEAGLTLEQAVDIAEALEQGAMAPPPAPVKSAAALRQAAYRERKRNAGHNECDVTSDVTRDVTVPRVRDARVVTPFSSSLRSEEVGGGGGECASKRVQPSDDWPDLKPTELVPALVALVASPWLDPDKSLALHTSSRRLAAWRRAGASWEHDVLPVVKALCAKQRSKISSWSFFDEAIARSIRDNRAALEIPAAQPRSTGPPSITDRIAAENAEARRLAFAMLDARNGSKN